MKKVDIQMLQYLTPCNIDHLIIYGNDTYYCGGSKHLSKQSLEARVEKVSKWVQRNGGKFEIKSDWTPIDRENYVKVVQIIFPSYGKRNMKEIMSTLFYK